MVTNRLEEIKKKGFSMSTNRLSAPADYARMKVGAKILDDAIFKLGDLKTLNSKFTSKENVLLAIQNNNISEMREISRFFLRISGIYARLVKHFADFYRYDWLLTPHVQSDSVSLEKVTDTFNKAAIALDKFRAKQFFGSAAFDAVVDGVYYGYIIRNSDNQVQIQKLDPKYCRSRFSIAGKPAVEFNMKFFDDLYKDQTYRLRVINAYPQDFKKGYALYREGKLLPDTPGDASGWYLLDCNNTVKFAASQTEQPLFISVIPHIIDLDAAQELDRKKMAQKLLKIIIQKLPMDKNGDLLFDVDEAQELHNNAVQMLSRAVGIDVLTTFAEVDVADLADKSSVTSIDELEKVERTVYNESGTAQNLFNTDGNIALEKSILDDEANIYQLLLQFEQFLNELIKPFNKNKKILLTVELLPTTIYNYKELSKLYKEQTALGYSKALPQVALGRSQTAVYATAKFENKILSLGDLFIPPQSSNTMSGGSKGGARNLDENGEEKKAGRKALSDDEKSEKTMQNIEAQG